MKENAKTYISYRLSKLVKDIPELQVSYKYDPIEYDHMIKVRPLEAYNTNELYKVHEEDLLFDFIDKFPDENLMFLSEGEWLEIDDFDEIFSGELFLLNELANRTFNNSLCHIKDIWIESFSKVEEDLLELPSGVLTDWLDMQKLEFCVQGAIDIKHSSTKQKIGDIHSDFMDLSNTYGRSNDQTCCFEDDVDNCRCENNYALAA